MMSASGTLDLQGRGRPLLNFNPSGDDDDDDNNVNQPGSTACADSNTKPSRELINVKASNLVKDDAYEFNIDAVNDDDDDDAFESLRIRNRRVKASEGNKKKLNNVVTETQAFDTDELQETKAVVSAGDITKWFDVRGNTNKEVKKLTHEKVIKLGQPLSASTERMLKGPLRNASQLTSLVVQDTKHNLQQAATSVLVEETQDMDQGWDQNTKLAIEQSQADLVVAETQGIDIENQDRDFLDVSSAGNGERFKNDVQRGKLMDYKIPRHGHVRGVNKGNNEKDSDVVTHDSSSHMVGVRNADIKGKYGDEENVCLNKADSLIKRRSSYKSKVASGRGEKRTKPPVVLETQDLDVVEGQNFRKKVKLRQRCFQLSSDSSDSETVPESRETEDVVNDNVVCESQPAGVVRRLPGSIKSTLQNAADIITSASVKVESEREVRGEEEDGDEDESSSSVIKKMKKLCNPDSVELINAGRDKGCSNAHTTFEENIFTADGGSNDYEPVVLGGNHAGKASRGQKKGRTRIVFDKDSTQGAMLDNEGNIYGTQVSETHRRMGRLKSSRKGGVKNNTAREHMAEHELLLLDHSDEDDGLMVKKETNASSYSRTHTVQSGNQTSRHSAKSMKGTTQGSFLKAEDATLQPGVSSTQMGSDGVGSSQGSEGLRRRTTDKHRRNSGDLGSSQQGQEHTSSQQQVSIS